MKLYQLIQVLQAYYICDGDIEVEMLIDWEDEQHQAPVRDTALSRGLKDTKVILIYEEDRHGQ
jgi:hypothetical protein